MITEKTSLQDLFNLAIKATKDVALGEIYTVKELFRGFEWNRIAKGNRTKLGSMYFAYSKNKGLKDISPLGKTPQNQQKYMKNWGSI